MATITLNPTILSLDFSRLPTIDSVFGSARLVLDAFFSAISSFPDGDPSSVTSSKVSYTNPSYGGYRFTGSASASLDSFGDFTSVSFSASKLVVNDGSGTTTFALAASASYNYLNDSYSASLKVTSTSYSGSDGSTWQLTGGVNASESNSNPNGTFAETYTSLSLGNGSDKLTFTGSISFDYDGNSSGAITAISGTVGGSAISLTGLSIDAETFSFFDLQSGIDGFLPDLLSGSDKITVSAALDRVVEGLSGNDTITGSSGSDYIDGGAGNDVINAGTGDDYIYAGLGDVIDGGTGNDIVDLDGLIDSDGNPLAYDLFYRSGIYTVTGTATALVLTDLASKKTIKFNNVESFVLGGETYSAGKLLAPNSRDVTGDVLLNGDDSGDYSPLGSGLGFVLDVYAVLSGAADLSIFDSESFSSQQNYNPDAGTFNFTFKGSNGSTFTFKDTHVADAGAGGSQTVTYGLTSSNKAVSFSGTSSSSASYTTKSGTTKGTGKFEISFIYADTQGTTSKTDDVSASFKFSGADSFSEVEGDSTFSLTQNITFSAAYSFAGLTLSASGTEKFELAYDSNGETTKGLATVTLTSYTLAYKNPDTSKSADRTQDFSIAFGGAFTTNELTQTQTFTVTKLTGENADLKITTASATLDLSESFQQGGGGSVFDGSFYSVAAPLLADDSGTVSTDLALSVIDFLGIFRDGEGNDSVLDAANAINIKTTAGAEVYAGAGNDTVTGGTGADSIDGGDGNDIINAGTGDDYIAFSAGTDAIDGGSGRDIFVVNEGFEISSVGGSSFSNFTLLNSAGGTSTIKNVEVLVVGTKEYVFTGFSSFASFKSELLLDLAN